MAEPTQILSMDAKQIAELHVVERYLADQLTKEEAEAFEAYIEAHPEVTREIENITRMKSGLATLQQRGDLKSIVGGAPARGWKQLALYAACAVAIFAVFMFLGRQWSVKAHAQLLAASAQELSPPGMSLRIAASILVTRTRGESRPALALPPRAGDVVELRLDLHAPETAARYSVELSRISGSALERLGTLADTAAQGGTLAVFVRGSALTPGNYLIRVSAAGGSEPLEFTLRVEGQPR